MAGIAGKAGTAGIWAIVITIAESKTMYMRKALNDKVNATRQSSCAPGSSKLFLKYIQKIFLQTDCCHLLLHSTFLGRLRVLSVVSLHCSISLRILGTVHSSLHHCPLLQFNRSFAHALSTHTPGTLL
ncbi:MAG: hypothetical protein EZS28_041222 [Streblomastix strix]|uniref:Uncharacterized protein n=1 Tax=Streblomastix strix TaxID=222440 RepID=A0A5J4TZQ2_9EUKA|nr:MAG: hypothetical protein EZS28_041222 [Streblomastix strix]